MATWRDIPGWTDDHLLAIYEQAVDEAQDGACFVEVGVAFGRSAAFAAQKIYESGKRIRFCCVDKWDTESWNEPEFNTVLQDAGGMLNAFSNCVHSLPPEIGKIIEPWWMSSVDAAEIFVQQCRLADLVFIDGDHSYESVRSDIAAWDACVKPGGVMAGHDFIDAHPGVRRAVEERFPGKFEQRESCWWVRY